MRRGLGVLVSLAMIGGVAACTEVSTNPSVVTAIELHAPALPGVVQGDTLRDTTGAPAPLVAVAFNGHNDTIPNAPFRFIALDTGIVTVDTLTGLVVARDTIGQARVIATAGTLQSVPVTIQVTRAPDSLQAASSPTDTLHYAVLSDGSLVTDTGAVLKVQLSHLAGIDTLVPVPNYLVQFAIVDPADLPADTSHVFLANDRRLPSRTDTTDAQGSASRRLLVPKHPSTTLPDSVIVEATAFKQDRARTLVPGSPARFIVYLVQLKTQ